MNPNQLPPPDYGSGPPQPSYTSDMRQGIGQQQHHKQQQGTMYPIQQNIESYLVQQQVPQRSQQPHQQQYQNPIVPMHPTPTGGGHPQATAMEQSLHEQPPMPSDPHQIPQRFMQEKRPDQTAAQMATEKATTAAKGAQAKLNDLIQQAKEHSKQKPMGPNLGFKPTVGMAKRHEDILISGKRPLFQFQVTKLRTWRTGYTRLLCLYDDHFSTVDPDSHQITNTWDYTTLTDYMAVEKDQFLLQVNSDKLKFQCHNVDRSVVLTAFLQCKDDYEHSMEPYIDGGMTLVVLCNRWTRHGHIVPSALRLTSYALEEIHPVTKLRIQTYRYVDIAAVSFLSDDSSGVIFHLKNRKNRLFCITNKSRSDLIMWMRQSEDRIGLELQMTESSTLQQWKDRRREEQRPRKSAPIATEWQVTKQSRRHDVSIVGGATEKGWPGGVVNRRLCITGTGQILEMDLSGMVVSIRQLSDLYAIVRPASAGDTIIMEYADGHSQSYSSQSRDALLVSLLDAATTLGKNPKVQVSDVSSGGYCLASFSTLTAPEKGGLFQPISIPLHCLRRVYAVSTAAFSYMNSNTESSTEEGVPINPLEECRNVVEICREFNASVLPTADGLPPGEKDKHVLGSIGSLWGLVAWLLELKTDRQLAEQSAGPLLQTLHRLSKTPAGYRRTIELATFLDCVPLLLTIDDAFSKFWGFRTLTVLLSGLPGKLREKEIEFVNKSVIFKTGGKQLIYGLVLSLLDKQASDLTRMVMSDILQSILCSFADTTGSEVFNIFMHGLGENFPALMNTLYQQTPFVLENSALLLHLLNSHAPEVAGAIRKSSLASGILLHHFHAAIFSTMAGQRFLSRFLCSLWLSGPSECDEKKLLKRMVPRGFLPYLKMPSLSRTEEEQLDAIEQDAVEENIPENTESAPSIISGSSKPTAAAGTNTARLRSRIALAQASPMNSQNQRSAENFRIFFHTLTQNHALPDLIWNQQTRRELRIGLESEIQYIHRETESRGIDKIAWNHQQFGIEYPSLDGELRVGSVYMRLWLQAGEGFIKTWDEPLRLFELLFRRFLCEMDRNTKVAVMCIRCLERLYEIHGAEIGAFPDVMILIRSMASTRNIETQHRLLGVLATILGVRQDAFGDERRVNVPENAEQLLNIESIEQMCQFVAWGHTNGVQVGNLMTNLLNGSHPKSVLLTDGTETRPDEKAKSGASANSAVKGCPPVWFVATTHKIPPPQEAVLGPFRVCDLRQMICTGEISSFTLVTSSHVDNYDEDGVDEVSEFQVDTGKWRRLDQIWQLRWQLCTDGNETGIYSASDVALLALLSLTRLVDLHRSLDSRGLPYYPIPIAKRIICGLSKDPFSSKSTETIDKRLSFLSIIAQSLLCNDPNVVDQAAKLLYRLTEYNEEATSKLYLTGVFFFMSCYTGSNFHGLAKLIHATHLKQHFRSGFAAAADKEELPLKDRSVLGGLLPEGVLYVLQNYGVEQFTSAFVGNNDTPEVIWNLDMRKHLIEMILQHLGDFPKRLWENTTTKYEYCPMPGVAYKRLEKEIFCHNYYLSNLCDEIRFPDWPISEPVEVFRACLEELKKQINRDEEEEEEALRNATSVLNLNPGDGSKKLRKAYRMLARKYHPDKNPGGREMFEAIQAAYELLLPVIESGQELVFSADSNLSNTAKEGRINFCEGFLGGTSQMDKIQLLIKTQILICKRFEVEMAKYKYPAYRLLLSCIKLPDTCQRAREEGTAEAMFNTALLSQRRAIFVNDSVELIYRTCLVSPLNAEELVSESGVSVLNTVFDFYVHAAKLSGECSISGQKECSIFGQDSASDGTVLQILSNVVHTFAGIAYYESGRSAIESLPDLSQFCLNWRRCIDGSYFVSKLVQARDVQLKRFALEGIANMSRNSILQNSLIGAGVLWPLVRLLLGYDPTLEESCVSLETLEDDVGVSQAAENVQARLATRALGRLSGLLQDPALATPANSHLQAALKTLLTRPICLLLQNKRTGEILRILNTNIESPSKIWSVEMRRELLKVVSSIEEKRIENVLQLPEEELKNLEGFTYRILQSEMQIGGIYIRVFNKLGVEKGGLRDIPDPGLFATQLVAFIARSINESKELPDDWIGLRLPVTDIGSDDQGTVGINDQHFYMAVSALRILFRVDGLVDEILYNQSTAIPSVLLSLLELPQESEVFEVGCDILSMLSSKVGFADAVAKQGALWRLLSVLERPGGQEDLSEENYSRSQIDVLRKQRGWTLLETLSSSPSVANKIVETSAWLELLGILVGYAKFTKVWIARVGAAKTLSRLLWDPRTGQSISPLLERFLPISLVVVLKEEGPDTMLKLFDGENDTPELIWDATMRAELRKVISQQLDTSVETRKNAREGNDILDLAPHVRVKYLNLENELFIGGVYVTRFLKEPTYNIRDPTSFLESLLQRWTHELQMNTKVDSKIGEEKQSHDIISSEQDSLQLVTDATVYLCKVRPSLCDKFSSWGYMERCLHFLDRILSQGLFGSPLLSVMRLLHVAVNRRVNVESLIASGANDRLHGIIVFTMQAIGDNVLHPDSGFMLEMLKKLFVNTLGDLTKTSYLAENSTSEQINHQKIYPAPSPAPGEGRVRVNVGDDPLGLDAPMLATRSAEQQTDPTFRPPNQGTGTGYFSSLNSHLSSNFHQEQGQVSSSSGIPYVQQSFQQQPFHQMPAQNLSLYDVNQQVAAQFPNQIYDGMAHGMGGGSSQVEKNRMQQYEISTQYHQEHPYTVQPRQVNCTQQHQFAHSSFAQRGAIAHETAAQRTMKQEGGILQQQSYTGLPRSKIQYSHGEQSHTPGSLEESQQRKIDEQSRQPFHRNQNGGNQMQQPFNQSTPSAQNASSWNSPVSGSQGSSFREQYHCVNQSNQSLLFRGEMHGTQSQTVVNQPSNERQQHPNFLMPPQSQHVTSQNAAPFTPSGTNEAIPRAAFQQPATTQQNHYIDGFSNTVQSYRPENLVPVVSIREAVKDNAASHQFGGSHRKGHVSPQKTQAPNIEGSGIDARTKPEPSIEAAKRADSSQGAPGSAEGRKALLESALRCDLPRYLVDSVLENPSLSGVKDPASVKVHAVELLKLLTRDPGYGMKFQLTLDKIPAWKKYVAQDHSLFITGPEQKADYFLTEGGSSDASKMLMQG